MKKGVRIVHPFLYENIEGAENMYTTYLNVNGMFIKKIQISLTHMSRRSYNKSIRYMNDCSYVQLKR